MRFHRSSCWIPCSGAQQPWPRPPRTCFLNDCSPGVLMSSSAFPAMASMGSWKALRTRRDRIRFVQVRHEEGAAFMACGYAKFTGRLGVCIATSGPGAIHLLNGLYDAKMDGAPVLAITGQTYHDLMGMHYQQEVNLLGLFEDVTVFNQQINGPKHAHSLVDAACRTALSLRGVAHLNCPNDWQELTDEDSSDMMVPGHTSVAWRPPIVVPQAETIKTPPRF